MYLLFVGKRDEGLSGLSVNPTVVDRASVLSGVAHDASALLVEELDGSSLVNTTKMLVKCRNTLTYITALLLVKW